LGIAKCGAERLAGALAVLLAGGDLERAERQPVVGVLEVRDVGLARTWRAILSANSLASEPPVEKNAWLIDFGQSSISRFGELHRGDGAVLARDLQHLPQLLGRRLDDPRVAVAGIVDEVAGGEVEVVLAVDVGDDAAASAFATITGSPAGEPTGASRTRGRPLRSLPRSVSCHP
jgi:hypothetical protein